MVVEKSVWVEIGVVGERIPRDSERIWEFVDSVEDGEFHVTEGRL